MPDDSHTSPIVTFIIPTFNRAFQIRGLLDLLAIEQSRHYPHLQIIVMDGGSKDGTTDVLKKFGSLISHWSSAPDTGVYDAFNSGLKFATGSYVRFVSDDDNFLLGHTRSMVDALESDPQLSAVAGQAKWWRVGNEGRSTPMYFPARLGVITAENVSRRSAGVWLVNECVFFRRSVMQRFGGYDTRYLVAADLELQLKILFHGGRIRVLPEIVLEKLLHGDTVTLRNQYRSVWESYLVLTRYGFYRQAVKFFVLQYAAIILRGVLPATVLDPLINFVRRRLKAH